MREETAVTAPLHLDESSRDGRAWTQQVDLPESHGNVDDTLPLCVRPGKEQDESMETRIKASGIEPIERCLWPRCELDQNCRFVDLLGGFDLPEGRAVLQTSFGRKCVQ